MATIKKPSLPKVYMWQSFVTLILCGPWWFIDKVQSYSFLIGCLIQISGGLYFARQAYKYQGARQVGSVVKSMYRGETGKIVLSAALFASVFITVKPLSAAFLFSGYIFMMILHIVLSAKVLAQHKF